MGLVKESISNSYLQSRRTFPMMMNFKAALFILAWVVCSVELSWTPYLEGSCSPLGFSCNEDCTKLQLCETEEGPPTIADVPCGSETDKKYCSVINGLPTCTAPVCEKIKCGAIGPVPSPSNCSQYYICDELMKDTANLKACPNNTRFDTTTKTCAGSNSDCKSEEPPICENNTGGGNLTDFCYACLDKNTFLIFACTTQLPTSSTTASTTLSTTEPTTEPTTSSTTASTTSSTTESPVKCTVANEKFPDRQDCRSFYVCVQNGSGSLVAQHYTCPNGYFYDSSRRSCFKGVCV